MKRVGLFFGSFNPIHMGHLALANYMCEFEKLQEVWFVVSPLNPFKKNDQPIDTHHRIEMVKRAIAGSKCLLVNDIETTLPLPSYTIDTLTKLHTLYPDNRFSIIMGADNIQMIKQWKEAERILLNYQILVYPRLGFSTSGLQLPPNVRITDAPLIEMASSKIREWIRLGKHLPYYVTPPVADYISQYQLYI